MRTGLAIRDIRDHCWLKSRSLVWGEPAPVSVWVQDEDAALTTRDKTLARRLRDAVRRESRHPDKIIILDPRWKEVR